MLCDDQRGGVTLADSLLGKCPPAEAEATTGGREVSERRCLVSGLSCCICDNGGRYASEFKLKGATDEEGGKT